MTYTHSSDRIIVGVDGSASSIDALREAAEVAAALGSPLQVVTTWEYPSLVGYSPPTEWSPEEDAHLVLDEAVAETFPDALPKDLTKSVVHGPATRTLIEMSNHARMLVLGSRGRGGFVGLLLGSVSSACAEHAHCPVLVVHRPQET